MSLRLFLVMSFQLLEGVGLYIDKNIFFTNQDDLNLLCNKCENI